MSQNMQGLSAVFGSPEMASLFGNVGGAVLGQYMANQQMAKQLSNQKSLQHQAFELNQKAVRSQALNEVVGLRQAGLNPATANGSGAPSVQAGSASVGSVPTLGNIFDGVAEIVAAAKMPTDIANTQANTANTQANTAATRQQIDFVTPAVVEKIGKEISNLSESVRNARNVNDAWESHDKFLRDQGKVIFDRMRTQLKDKGLFDSLAPDTQTTLDDLAEGSISVGQGEFEALMRAIDTQSKISDADSRLLSNAFNNTVLVRQFQDSDVMRALVQSPQDIRNKMYKEMKKVDAEISGIMQDIEVGKADVALKRAQKLRTDFERESDELNDVKWLAKHGRFDDVDVRTSEQSLENFQQLMQGLTRAVEMYAAARIAGTSAKPDATPPAKPVVVQPNEGQLFKYNNPKLQNLDKYLDWKR